MKHILTLAAPVMMLVGCATDPEPTAPVGVDPVDETPASTEVLDETPPSYRLEVEPGHTVAFYESAPGVVAIFEEVERGQVKLAPRAPNIAGYFAAARPGEAMPEALRAIAQRADAVQAQARPAGERGRVVASGGHAYRGRTSSNADGFINGGKCDAEWYGGSYLVELGLCQVNWSGGWSVVWNETRMVQGHVEALQGNVTLRVQAGAAAAISKTVLQGKTVYAIAFANEWVTHRLDVANASNDWFHVHALYRQCPDIC
jgi:hypothetical protein